MLDHRRPGVNTEDRDVRAVDRAAHVEAARIGHAKLGRKIHVLKAGHELIHDRLDGSRGIGGRRVAVDPALGVDDVGNAVAHAADGEAVLFDFGDEGGDVRLVTEQELNIVAAGEAQVSTAVLVGDIRKHADGADGEQAGGPAANGEDFGA